MSKDHIFSYRVNKDDRDKDKELGRTRGIISFAKLLDRLRDAYRRNPDILEVTQSTESAEILESLEKSFSVFDDLGSTLVQHEQRLEKIDSLLKKVALHVGMSKTEIKEAQKNDISGEAVFEE